MTQKLILDNERDRRFFYLLGAGSALAIWFYEFPLYLLLRGAVALVPSYREANPDIYAIIPPSLTMMDVWVLGVVVLLLAYIWANPKSYVAKQESDAGFEFYLVGQDGEPQQLPQNHFETLEILSTFKKQKTYNKVSKSWISSNRRHVEIRSAKKPRAVFFDQSSIWDIRARQVARQVEAFFGNVAWKDRDNIL